MAKVALGKGASTRGPGAGSVEDGAQVLPLSGRASTGASAGEVSRSSLLGRSEGESYPDLGCPSPFNSVQVPSVAAAAAFSSTSSLSSLDASTRALDETTVAGF